MTTVEKIKISKASVKELSILSGISADKMYNWVQGKSNPGGNDIVTLEAILTNIGNLSRDEIKVLVQSKKVNKKTAHNIPKKNSQTSDDKDGNAEENEVDSMFTKKVEDMSDNEFIRYMYLQSEKRWDNLLAAHNTLVDKLPELRKEDWYKQGGNAPISRKRERSKNQHG